jgi:hypothetical protein
MTRSLFSLSFLATAALAACTEDPAGPEGTSTALLLCGNGIAEVGELCVAAPTTVRATTSALITVLAVDVDADGRRDLVGVTSTQVYVVLGAPGGFGLWSFYQPAGGPAFGDVAAGDFDGDGDLDIAATDTANDRVMVRLHTVGASFAPPTFLATGDQPTRIHSTRMNGDALDDLIILADGANNLEVRLATGGGGFAAAVSYAAGDARDFAIGNCDGTGGTDVMYMNGTGTAAALRARQNNYAGVLSAPVSTAWPLGPTVAIPHYSKPLAIVGGRMNNDTWDDVVVSAEWSRLATGRSNGNCTFTKLPEVQSYAWATRLRLGDHDGNGTLDIAAPHYTDAFDDELSVVFGIGNGNLDPAYGLIQRPTGTEFYDAAFGDFNDDGARDLITASRPGFLLHRGTP